MLRSLADFVFPTMSPLDPAAQLEAGKRLEDDIKLIKKCDWSKDSQAALEQAVRLSDLEFDRRRAAESKASTYLAVLAALVPVVLSIQAAGWEKKVGPAPDWLRLTILCVAIVYTAAAGWFAVRTLQVSGFHTMSESEMAKAWSSDEPVPNAIREILTCARDSQNAVNRKVTYVKLTHMHLLRAFGCFILLMLLDPVVSGMRKLAAADNQTPAIETLTVKQVTVNRIIPKE